MDIQQKEMYDKIDENILQMNDFYDSLNDVDKEALVREINAHMEENERLAKEARERRILEEKKTNEENEKLWEDARKIVLTKDVVERASNQLEFIRREVSKKWGYDVGPISQLINKDAFMSKWNKK